MDKDELFDAKIKALLENKKVIQVIGKNLIFGLKLLLENGDEITIDAQEDGYGIAFLTFAVNEEKLEREKIYQDWLKELN